MKKTGKKVIKVSTTKKFATWLLREQKDLFGRKQLWGSVTLVMKVDFFKLALCPSIKWRVSLNNEKRWHIFSTYSFPQNACSKTEQGLVGSSQVLPPWSGYSVHRTFLLSRNWNFGRWFLSDNSYHTQGWLLLRTSWRQIPAEPFHLCYLLVYIVYLQIWCLSRRQYRRAKQLSTTWINHWTA